MASTVTRKSKKSRTSATKPKKSGVKKTSAKKTGVKKSASGAKKKPARKPTAVKKPIKRPKFETNPADEMDESFDQNNSEHPGSQGADWQNVSNPQDHKAGHGQGKLGAGMGKPLF